MAFPGGMPMRGPPKGLMPMGMNLGPQFQAPRMMAPSPALLGAAPGLPGGLLQGNLIPTNLMPMAAPSSAMTTVQLPALLSTVQLPASLTDPNARPITLFVGGLSDKVPDGVVREVLQKCGRMLAWKRVRGASGNLQAFGFVEFDGPEAALRAKRLLTDFKLAGRAVKITVDEKNTRLLEAYSKAREEEAKGEEEKQQTKAQEEKVDDDVRAEIEALVADLQLIDLPSRPVSDSEEKPRARSPEREREEHRDSYRRDRDRDRERERERERDRSSGRDRDRDRRSRREHSAGTERGRSTHDRWRDDNEERPQDRKKRNDELEYKERERLWEKKEKERMRAAERDVEREQQREDELQREAVRTQELMASYDDDLDNDKYYSVSHLQRKRRDRQRELELDDRDRQAELEARLLNPAQNPPSQSDAASTPTATPGLTNPLESRPPPTTSTPPPKDTPSLGGSRLTAADVFGGVEEDEGEGPVTKKRRKPAYVKFDEQELLAAGYTQEKIAEERKRLVKGLIDRIPTAKAALYAFEIDWDYAAPALFEKKIMPWVNKKICEYIGEEEPNLAEYICEKVRGHSGPVELEADVGQVLDEEAGVFMIKLWRLLAYETEAAKMGLA